MVTNLSIETAGLLFKIRQLVKARKTFSELTFLIHTMKKDSKRYDDVYYNREQIRKYLELEGVTGVITDNMNKISILVYMYENPFVKVTHNLFAKDEYIYYDNKDDCIKDEYGHIFEDWDTSRPYNGILMRDTKSWENGWSIYKEK